MHGPAQSPRRRGITQELAELEYFDNLSVLAEDASDPAISKADYNGGTNNSVVVTASTTRSLPFTQIVWGKQVEISVRAQASFQAATNYTTCLLALDPDDPAALEFGGSTTGLVTCGAGALSTSSTAVVKNGNPSVKISDIISGGGIDAGLTQNGSVHQYISNLSNPFDGIEPPASSTPRTYDCGTKNSAGSGTADVVTTTTTTYTYWQGKNRSSATPNVTYKGTGYRDGSVTTTTATNQTVDGTVSNGLTSIASDTEDWTGNRYNSSIKNTFIYEKQKVVVAKTYSNVNILTVSSGNASNLQPGTYSTINVACQTYFNPGIYYVTGSFDLGQNQLVVGDDVLFVLTGNNSANFSVNSQSKVRLSGITQSRLMSVYGMAEADAARLAGMIIFDEKSSAPIRINGGADIIFEGTVYAPKRNATFNGSSSMNGKCMMLAVATIKFTGTNDFSSFCIPPQLNPFDVGGTTIQVRLVA